ncbi:hypothetical protein C8F04DRAFT_1172069 [Mycena alexandri]|uniref:Uncharacterized protein n=1 Tax=Mycena alexandri TaxID=1745969 RepID=A0AAD6TKX2_9AGAR|nr:hypothetical protein C8F04DRAFT_1172069 [Mycena alexandri]
MPQSPSFFRTWGRKDRAQSSPTQGFPQEVPTPSRSSSSSPVSGRPNSKRRPSDTLSDGFLRLFKSSHAEPDASSLASVDEQRHPQAGSPSRAPHSLPFHSPPTDSPDDRSSPVLSPRSLDRPLPPVPPVRPPRPPSLNLYPIPIPPAPIPPKSVGSRRMPQRQRLIPGESSRRPGHKMPELDNVWEGFIRDAEGEDIDDFFTSPRRSDRPPYASTASLHSRGAEAILDPSFTRKPRPTLYRAGGSESTPYLLRTPDLTSDSDSEYSSDETVQKDVQFPLSLFPPPPPLLRRRMAPKPLVLLPTPSIAPLPPSPAFPSPSFSSAESTPVATPTTPRSVEPSLYSSRKSLSPSPISILKKPGSSFSARSRLDSTPPPTPGLTGVGGLPNESSTAHRTPSPRLRSAQSVPHLQPLLLSTSNAHRNTSSDTTSVNTRRRVASRPQVDARPQLYTQPPFPAAPPVQWGYAV